MEWLAGRPQGADKEYSAAYAVRASSWGIVIDCHFDKHSIFTKDNLRNLCKNRI